MAGIKVDPPPVNMQIIDMKTGRPTRPFIEFLHRIWKRTGGDDAVSAHVALADPHAQYAEIAGGAAANFTAMPQVGGDPVVESGSNADGEWTKFSDGTLLLSSSVTGNTFTNSFEMRGVGTLPISVTNTTGARLFGELDNETLRQKITLIRLPSAGTSTIALRVYSANGDFVSGDETDAVINVFTFARWK